jgi:hypothetical protein
MNQSQTLSPSSTEASGALAVSPDAVILARRENTAKLTLSAARGPVTWHAVSSSNKITLSIDHGRIPADGKAVIMIAFKRGVLELPGNAAITITDAANRRHVVTVSWEGSLL